MQERIARLERDGVIAGDTVRLGARRQPGVQAYILVSAEGPNHDRAVAMLAGIPEIKSCESLSGEVDVILRVEAETLAGINRVRDLVGGIAGIQGRSRRRRGQRGWTGRGCSAVQPRTHTRAANVVSGGLT